MQFKKTGLFATRDQLNQISNSFNLAFNTPQMATLPGGIVPQPKEDFRDMANRFAVEAGLPESVYGVCPETLEFVEIIE